MPPSRVQVGVSAMVVRDGRLLLVLRARGVAAGTWSIPGGHLEPGERITEAIAREVAEETGLDATVGALLGIEEWIDDERHYVIVDHWATVPEGAVARAADDAADVMWADRAALDELPLVPGLRDWLDRHGVLPEPPSAT